MMRAILIGVVAVCAVFGGLEQPDVEIGSLFSSSRQMVMGKSVGDGGKGDDLKMMASETASFLDVANLFSSQTKNATDEGFFIFFISKYILGVVSFLFCFYDYLFRNQTLQNNSIFHCFR